MTPMPKPVTHVDLKYRKWMRSEPCDFCERTWVDRCLAHRSGGGMGKKDHDRDGIALCDDCHKMEHRGSETFRAMLEIQTGKTWEQHAERHWAKYQEETGCKDHTQSRELNSDTAQTSQNPTYGKLQGLSNRARQG